MDLKWKIRPYGEATLVEVEGEIDLHSAPGFKSALLELDAPLSARVALDMSGVSFLDSTGIGALVGVLKKTRERGGQIAFFGAQPRVKRVFEIAGLWSALPFFASRDAALAHLLPASSPVPSEAPERAPQGEADGN